MYSVVTSPREQIIFVGAVDTKEINDLLFKQVSYLSRRFLLLNKTDKIISQVYSSNPYLISNKHIAENFSRKIRKH